MRTYLILFSLLFAMPSMASSSDRSEHLVNILTEYKVPSYGRRQEQEANVSCRIPKKNKLAGVECLIVVSPPGNELNTVYEEIRGEKAEEVSALLKEFHITPEGKNSNQQGLMRCRLPKVQKPDSLPVCERIPVELFRD